MSGMGKWRGQSAQGMQPRSEGSAPSGTGMQEKDVLETQSSAQGRRKQIPQCHPDLYLPPREEFLHGWGKPTAFLGRLEEKTGTCLHLSL